MRIDTPSLLQRDYPGVVRLPAYDKLHFKGPAKPLRDSVVVEGGGVGRQIDALIEREEGGGCVAPAHAVDQEKKCLMCCRGARDDLRSQQGERLTPPQLDG